MTDRLEGEKKRSTTQSKKLMRYVYFINDTFLDTIGHVILVGLEATNNEKRIFSKLKDQILSS
jgi:hypothetical protein